MTERRPVNVVNVTSPSYTGTTWLCLLLGSHPRAFTLGPPDRVYGLLRDGGDSADACRVHGADCPFWPAFFKSYDPGRNFYEQLATHADRDFIVINNPTPAHAKAELTDPAIVVRPIRMIRDGRALANSYARHHRVDFYDAVVDFARLLPAQFPWEPDRDDILALRYEDLLNDQHAHIARFASFLGLDYDERALSFWEFDHHITSGNAGSIALLKFFQGLEVPNFRHREFYEQQFETMRKGETAFDDRRWEAEVGVRERLIFDHYCGEGNAGWGYDPDRFTAAERARFQAELRDEQHPARAATAERMRARAGAARRTTKAVLDRLGRSRRRLAAALAAVWFASIALTWLVAWLVHAGP